MPAARKPAAAKTTTRKAATTRKPAKKASKPAPRKRAAAKKVSNKVSSPATEQEKRPGPGRPPLLEKRPELQRDIVTYVRAGAFPERAAIAVGVSERSHYAWMAAGREEHELREAGGEPDPEQDICLGYFLAIEKAVAEAEMLLLGSAVKGGSTGGAAMSILERRFRDRWGAKAPAAPPAGPAPTGPATPLDMLEARRQAREQTTR